MYHDCRLHSLLGEDTHRAQHGKSPPTQQLDGQNCDGTSHGRQIAKMSNSCCESVSNQSRLRHLKITRAEPSVRSSICSLTCLPFYPSIQQVKQLTNARNTFPGVKRGGGLGMGATMYSRNQLWSLVYILKQSQLNLARNRLSQILCHCKGFQASHPVMQHQHQGTCLRGLGFFWSIGLA